MTKTALIWSEEYLNFDLGKYHPMNPSRLIATYELMSVLGFVDDNQDKIEVVKPQPVSDDILMLFHKKEYINQVKKLSVLGMGSALEYGLGTSDCPVFPKMHEISSIIVGGAIEAVKKVWNNHNRNGFALLGGLHHAFAKRASGFCYYNDAVLAIKYLQKKYDHPKVLYVDTDVHHGDGVLTAFYSDPSVLAISLHESGDYIFPGTGYPNEIGAGSGRGYTINIPFAPDTWDDYYYDTFEELVVPLWEEFNPDFIIWQCGTDTHYKDLLGNLKLTNNVYQKLARKIVELSTYADEKLVLLGGGGYNPDSVARSWTVIFSEIVGEKIPSKTPDEWIDFCYRKYGINASKTIIDPPIEQDKIVNKTRIRMINDRYKDILKEKLGLMR